MALNNFPKTREGLLKLIAETLCRSETVYVSFCAELEAFENGIKQPLDEPHDEMSWFCNNRCHIHKLHSAQMLFCLPISCKKLLVK